ncbi:MAG: hypothetical protein J2P38_01535 [Candidatus Dormibacteraeota bacterium]|nr:hypothetical protein [Candidatus Dormibacteraeota bacterium]
MGDVGAIPSELEDWSGWTQGLNDNLTAMARQVNDLVIAFNGASQEPRFTGQIPTIGDELAAHAARNQVVDQWVGRVGMAFQTLDHRNVPAQVYKANMEDFGHGVVTVPESMITRQVGGDPVRAAQDAAAGTKLAFRIRDAQARGDTAQVQALLARFAGQSGTFPFAFFQNLGPDGTTQALYAIWALRGSDQFQPVLKAFDSGLGQATTNPAWNPAFTSALLGRDWQGAWQDPALSRQIPDVQLSLLQYGTYSEAFLTQAADLLLFPSFDQVPLDPLNPKTIVFDALARNPDAAYDYLTGTHTTIEGTVDPRIATLLEASADGTPGENEALARLISAADSSSMAGWDDGVQLLQDIGQVAATLETIAPATLRPAIADLIAKHVDQFVPPDPDAKVNSEWTWQEYLFKLAESDGEGHVDWGAVTRIQDAMSRWVLAHGPATFDTHNDTNVRDWEKYLKQAGVLYGLTALPIKQAPYDAEKIKESQVQFISTLVSLIPFGSAVPGEHAVIEYLVDQTAEKIRVYLEKHPPGHLKNPDAAAVTTYYEQAAVMRQALAVQWLAHHPGLIPPGTSRQDVFTKYVTPMALGKNPFGRIADVDQFLFDLGTADEYFHDQFGLPTTR